MLSATQRKWERQRQMMVRIGRLRASNNAGDEPIIQALIDHFGLAGDEPLDGLTHLDVRMALTTQLETVFQNWKLVRSQVGACNVMLPCEVYLMSCAQEWEQTNAIGDAAVGKVDNTAIANGDT